VPVRLALLPFGPVTVEFRVHVPPEQVVVLLRLYVLPAGPVTWPDDEHVPPEHEPLPDELQLPPYGPVPLPERFQPASAPDAPASTRAVAKAMAPNLIMGVLLIIYQNAIGGAG
jgi:hypothetical protein